MNDSHKLLKILAAACMVFAVITAGAGLLHVIRDALGYIIYLSVFAVPVVYFYRKRKKDTE